MTGTCHKMRVIHPECFMRILIIDDSRVFQMGMKSALVKAGHEVTVASDGEEGLGAARQRPPDLILLDMMLPMMSGPEVLAALKSEPTTKDIPVFVLTGLSQRNEDKLLKAGATKYFEKSDRLLEHNFAALVETVGAMLSPQEPGKSELKVASEQARMNVPGAPVCKGAGDANIDLA